jgi:hypothetical protein
MGDPQFSTLTMRIIMNSTLATDRRHEPHEQHDQALVVRRVGIVDRAALHLGVALIKWGRRPGATPARERRVNRAELALLHRDRQFALASLANETGVAASTGHLAPLR